VGIQYLEAIRRLKQNGQSCERTIHISFVPDMEIGGVFGMKDLVNTSYFRNLNVGFALDGGMASVDEYFFLFYGEKSTWQVEIKCVNTLVNGLPMVTPVESAGAKFRYVLDHFMNFRAFEQDRQSRLKPWEDTLCNVTTINLTKIWVGITRKYIVLVKKMLVIIQLNSPILIKLCSFDAFLYEKKESWRKKILSCEARY